MLFSVCFRRVIRRGMIRRGVRSRRRSTTRTARVGHGIPHTHFVIFRTYTLHATPQSKSCLLHLIGGSFL
ncbi:hypothetical protein HBI23_245160 [Parastagonospora nodorum]|nr:hypothetical protein HBI47_245810 [Parastagonospora nodorum]KAH5619124.1 hypothetical protein HBI23_245160 [Parastagonospora nodorum]